MTTARSRRCLSLLACFILFAAGYSSNAQGGPPFRTDDPETPGNRHWEINVGFIGDRNPGTGAYQVPDLDINYGLGERLQLKYELPLAINETRAVPASQDSPAVQEKLLGGIGESLLGVKWRFYEHRPKEPILRGFGTGLLDLFRHQASNAPPAASGDSPGVRDKSGAKGEKEPVFELGTYPQIYLDNPTSAVPRGLVAAGPNFYLPLEISGHIGPIRYNADGGYNFGNRNLQQSWNRGLLVGHQLSDRSEAYIEIYNLQDANRLPLDRGSGNYAASGVKQRETTLALGGRQALNQAKTLNLLLLGGRSFQTPSAANGQPGWIAYVGLQLLFGPKERSPFTLSPMPPRPGTAR